MALGIKAELWRGETDDLAAAEKLLDYANLDAAVDRGLRSLHVAGIIDSAQDASQAIPPSLHCKISSSGPGARSPMLASAQPRG
mgnify:CR=1 FL=1